MTIDNEMMLQLERQAALSLPDAERAGTAIQMNELLSALDVLLTCPDTPPQREASPCPLRADEVRPSMGRTKLLSNAAETDGAFFLVPRAVE